MIQLTEIEAKLLLYFLDDLGDRLGSAGCNDFDLGKFVADHQERLSMIRDYHRYNGDPEEFDPNMEPKRSRYELADFCVVDRHRSDCPGWSWRRRHSGGYLVEVSRNRLPDGPSKMGSRLLEGRIKSRLAGKRIETEGE